MKRISTLIMGLLLTSVFTWPAFAGTLTTNKFLYKPSLGARGGTEKTTFDAGLDRIDARLGKEIWVGDPNYGATLQDAITAIGTTNKTILRVPTGAWAITADLTIPANITVKVEMGAVVDIADAKTLTINGSLDAGPYRIFSWTGTGKVVFAATSPQVDLLPEWWGAVGDNSTDDLAAFKAAVACAKDSGKGNIVLSRMYKLSDTLSLNNFQAWPTDQRISITGQGMKKTGFTSEAYNYPALELIGSWNVQLSHFKIVGSGTAGKIPTVALLLARSTTASTNSDNHIHHLAIYGSYQYGQVLDANGSDNRYDYLESYTSCPVTDNNWKFGFCFDGKKSGVDYVLPFGLTDRNGIYKTGSAAQSSDNCSLTNSSVMHTGGVPVDSAAYLIDFAWVNFYNVYTGPLAGASSDIFRLKSAYSCTFIRCPIESTHRYTFNISSTAGGSTMAGIYAQGIKSSSTPTQALITDGNTMLKDCFFNLTEITGGNVSLGGGAQTSTFKLARTATAFTQAAGVYSVLGNYIDFGSSMVNFDINPSGYAKNNIVMDQRSFSGGPVSGPQTLIDGDVQVGPSSFVTPNVLTLNAYKMTWRTAAPTTGTYARGSVIWKSDAAAGGSPGWVCVHDNTFGTLNAGNTTGTITSGTKLLTVNTVTGLKIGDFIDVVADGGGLAVNTGRIVNINAGAKVVTLAANAASTATDKAVSFHNHTTAEAFSPIAPTGARNAGVTSAAATPITVTHGLGVAPTKVLLTSVDGVPTGVYPSDFGATTFLINFAGGGSRAFYWEAIQ